MSSQRLRQCVAGLVLSLALLSGCESMSPSVAGPVFRVETQLFLGLGLNEGGTITDAAFQKFVDAEVAPRFPDGFTILDAQGEWREGSKAYREPSRVLIVLHDGSPDASAKLEAIRTAYKAQFRQSAVLRIDDSISRASL
ncbi:MAG: DUF3574 domain-containing protein [Tepidisphaeraceae bacterium]